MWNIQRMTICWCIYLSVAGRIHSKIKNSDKVGSKFETNSEDNAKADSFTVFVSIPIEENGVFADGGERNGVGKNGFGSFSEKSFPQDRLGWRNTFEHYRNVFLGNGNGGGASFRRNLGDAVQLKAGEVLFVQNTHAGGFGVKGNNGGGYRLINGNNFLGHEYRTDNGNDRFIFGFNDRSKFPHGNPMNEHERWFGGKAGNQNADFGNFNFHGFRGNARNPEDFNQNAYNKVKEGFMNPTFLVNNNDIGFGHNSHSFQNNENAFGGFLRRNTDGGLERKDTYSGDGGELGRIIKRNTKDEFNSQSHGTNDFGGKFDGFKANNGWIGKNNPDSNVKDVRWFYQGSNKNDFKNHDPAGNKMHQGYLLRNGKIDIFGSQFTATNNYEKKFEPNGEKGPKSVDLRYRKLNRVPEHGVPEYASSTKDLSSVLGVQYGNRNEAGEINGRRIGVQKFSDKEIPELKLGSSASVTSAHRLETGVKRSSELDFSGSAIKEIYNHAGNAFKKRSNNSEGKNVN